MGSLKNTVDRVHNLTFTGQYRLTIYWTPPSAVRGSIKNVDMTKRWCPHFSNPQLFREDKTFTEIPVIQGWPPTCPLSRNSQVKSFSCWLGTPWVIPPVCSPAGTSGQRPNQVDVAMARTLGQSLIRRSGCPWLLFRDLLPWEQSLQMAPEDHNPVW